MKNIAASIHQRLLNQARQAGRPFNEVLQYYAMERFLYRLCVSKHAKKFVLKGALMFTVWRTSKTRSTMDIDLLGNCTNATDETSAIVRDICMVDVEPDGLSFDTNSVSAEYITEDADYEGIRLRVRGSLGTARISIQIDIGFADAVVPKPTILEYPTILDLPAPRLPCYSKESMIAEKFQAMTKLGILNSRMKDFYDIWLMSQEFDFEGNTLAKAVKETFNRRKTEMQDEAIVFLKAFAAEESKQRQWNGFLRRSNIDEAPSELADVITRLDSFLGPIVYALVSEGTFTKNWNAQGPWI